MVSCLFLSLLCTECGICLFWLLLPLPYLIALISLEFALYVWWLAVRHRHRLRVEGTFTVECLSLALLSLLSFFRPPKHPRPYSNFMSLRSNVSQRIQSHRQEERVRHSCFRANPTKVRTAFLMVVRESFVRIRADSGLTGFPSVSILNDCTRDSALKPPATHPAQHAASFRAGIILQGMPCVVPCSECFLFFVLFCLCRWYYPVYVVLCTGFCLAESTQSYIQKYNVKSINRTFKIQNEYKKQW